MQTRPFHVCLVCSSCPSVRDFACSFLQISPHGEHPCCLANGSHYQAHSGLSPPSYCPCRANIKKRIIPEIILLKKKQGHETPTSPANRTPAKKGQRTVPCPFLLPRGRGMLSLLCRTPAVPPRCPPSQAGRSAARNRGRLSPAPPEPFAPPAAPSPCSL